MPLSSARPVLLIGGAPALAVDALRYLTVRASGRTAAILAEDLRCRGLQVDLLLSSWAQPQLAARRYDDRAELERQLRDWLSAQPHGVLLLSAAINDYQIAAVELRQGDRQQTMSSADKIPSGADEVLIRLHPADKLIDRLRNDFGHCGPLVACKYEAAASVVTSAQALRRRVGADVVVANSLDGSVNALVDADQVEQHPDRASMLTQLGQRIAVLASADGA